jgi:hypothetical protein
MTATTVKTKPDKVGVTFQVKDNVMPNKSKTRRIRDVLEADRPVILDIVRADQRSRRRLRHTRPSMLPSLRHHGLRAEHLPPSSDEPLLQNIAQHGDALALLRALPVSCTSVVFFDPSTEACWTS